MIRWARDFRLIPVVLIATVCLFALKVSGIVFDGGYTLADRLQGRNKTDLTIVSGDSVPDYPRIVIAGDPSGTLPAPRAKKAWAQEMFNFNGDGDITGSVEKKEDKPAAPAAKPEAKTDPKTDAKSDAKTDVKPPDATKVEAGNSALVVEPGRVISPGERAILESLQNRRQALDQRTRDLDMRENLLKATEKRVEAKVNELRDMENKIKASLGERDKAEAERFKSIITMYEGMKPKEAARIFDKLDMKVLIDVAIAMNPRSMSQILAQMAPDAAERLTVEIANRSSASKPASDVLPKIENKPSGT